MKLRGPDWFASRPPSLNLFPPSKVWRKLSLEVSLFYSLKTPTTVSGIVAIKLIGVIGDQDRQPVWMKHNLGIKNSRSTLSKFFGHTFLFFIKFLSHVIVRNTDIVAEQNLDWQIFLYVARHLYYTPSHESSMIRHDVQQSAATDSLLWPWGRRLLHIASGFDRPLARL